MRSYLRYWCEAFRLPELSRASRSSARIGVDGDEHARRARSRPAGVILALPHMGNWDHAGAWLDRHRRAVHDRRRAAQARVAVRAVRRYRESLGMEVLPLTGGDGAVPHAARERLRERRRASACSADRDLTEHGVEVDFFGEPARMPAGPAALAHRHRRGAAAGRPLVSTADGRGTCGSTTQIPLPADGDRGREGRAR